MAATIARRQQFQGETETQIAVATILRYTAFAIALLFALLIAGVNFAGLAIIAGALSVGIGPGLQNIVNIFASGLILLMKKPIKPVDRVVVGNTEGFVKKVRDRNWRVVCEVGVKYGIDVGLVKFVLLDVASKHPDIIQEEPNKPIVLFRNFGDSSLIFELWCIIRDINKKFVVNSELNFSINEAFR